jgi:hypothetical protein
MSERNIPTEVESLPPIFSPQRFFLDAPKQPRGTCFVLNTDFQLVMAEVNRLQEFITSEFFKRVTYKQENETLRERNAWLENYVKACDNEIKRAYARTAPDVPENRFECAYCKRMFPTADSRNTHQDGCRSYVTRPAEPSTQCPSCGLNHGACMC